MSEGYSVRQLSIQSRHSKSKITRIINHWLKINPENKTSYTDIKYILFDGTFINGRKSIVAVMNNNNHKIFYGEYGVAENSAPQLKHFFQPLIKEGFNPKSATVDGNMHVIKLFKQLWPDIIIQRCLVHVQRQGMVWCRKFPKRTDAKHLRNIFKRITYIRTIKERDIFISDLKIWEQKYGCRLALKPEKGKVFSDIKRARSMILKALPNMFHYLDDESIPFSTNGLEGYFSRLKNHYRNHRGLSSTKRKRYFKWYFYLQNT